MATGTIAESLANGPLALDVADGTLFEIVDGEAREVSHMGALAGTLASFLMFHLNTFALPKKLGFAVIEVLFNFGPGRRQRRPDLAFIRKERWKARPNREDPQAWNVVPNLMAEVVSPSNTADEIEEKLLEYFEAGVEIVWVFYPKQARVYVYKTPAQADIVSEGGTLEGGTVLPGFSLKISDLYVPLEEVL